MDAVESSPTALDQDHVAPYTVLQRRKHSRVVFTLPEMLGPIYGVLDSFLFQPFRHAFPLANMIGHKACKANDFKTAVEGNQE